MDSQTPTRKIQPIKPSRVLILGIAAMWLILPRVEAGVSLTTLVSFNQTNGASPEAGLVQGSDGNFYGTTAFGGPGGSDTNGTVFQMTPAGIFTNLISFNSTNGAGPRAGLVQGADGSFYGTTYNGGSNNAGTIFRLTTNGALTTLVTLIFGDTGGYPKAGLIQGQDGNFYGTTSISGTNGYGTAFQLLTNQTLTTLVSFDKGNAGGSPYAGLVQANDGNLYGTTYQGGTNGFGTIFKLTTNGTFTSLYSFTGANDGKSPYAGLVQGNDGSLYGTTYQGGTNGGYGTIFKLTTNGILTTLVSFDNTNGAYPQAGLIRGKDGNFYGTTTDGGTNGGYGTIFKLTTNGTFTSLYSFTGANDGKSPYAGLVQGNDGSLYGTTYQGGTNGYGTVFQLTVPLPPSFLTVERTGATLTLTWSATVGQIYQMLYKTNLNQPTWSNLTSSLTATNLTMTTLDALGPDRQRFYRILSD
jgi:uncharacterized repeat protein (TIGR03803 family)